MIDMGYFGTSGPKSSFAHSIGAGYQRQLNLNNARKTSPFGRLGEVVKSGNEPLKLSTFNTSKAVNNTIETRGRNILDRANDAYNTKVASRYGPVNELFNKVDTWRAYEADVVSARKRDYEVATARHTAMSEKIVMLEDGHGLISANVDLIADNRAKEVDFEKHNNKLAEIKSVFPSYSPSTYNEVMSAAKADLNALAVKKETAKTRFRNATVVLDRVHMKGVEDWMVDGPLMRESKTALVVTPIMLGLGFVAAYYAFKPGRTSTRSPTANKSAAFAVFS